MPQKSRPDPANGTVISADEYEGLMLGSAEDGIIGTPGNLPAVFADATGRQLKIRSGRQAMVRGYTWWSDPIADEVFDNNGVGLPANTDATNTRIDRLVLRLDRTTRQIRTTYLQGVPAATPQPPALTQDTSTTSGKWDFPLAQWKCLPGYTTIAATDLTYEAFYRPPFGNRFLCRTPSRPFGAYTHLGMEITDYDTEEILRWDGAGWAHIEFIVPKLFARRTSSGGASGGTNLINDAELWVNVKANSVYTFLGRIIYTSSTTAKFKNGFLGPDGSQVFWNYGGIQGGFTDISGGEYHGLMEVNGGTEYAAGVGPFTHAYMRPSGLLVTGNTAGRFQFQWAQQNQDNVYGTQVWMGSWIELTRRL